MANNIRIGIDALGFENDPIVAYEAIKEFCLIHNDVDFVLIGNEALKQKITNKQLSNVRFVLTENFVKMDDDVNIIRKYQDLSIQIGCDLLNNKEIDGLFSACNTAVFVATTYIKLGTLPNVKRFAFLATMPTVYENQYIWFLDNGANKEVNGYDLYQFAIMANVYATKIGNMQRPRVGLVNIGTEASKGFLEHKEADELLKKDQNINYVGFVETRGILTKTDADIFVCNGYTGNIVLKTLEGAFKTLGVFLKEQYKKWYNVIPYLFNKHIINTVRRRFDYKVQAGAFLVGLSKPVIKGHGSSDKVQILSCINMMYNALKQDVFNTINEEIQKQIKPKHD